MSPLPDWLQSLDQDAFLWLHTRLHRGPLHEAFRLLNELGNGWVLAPLLLAIVALSRSGRRGTQLFAALALALLAVSVAVHHLKQAFPRDRPPLALAAAFARGEATVEFDDARNASSLPSGHAATVSALAGVLWWWAAAIPIAWRRRGARTGLLVLATGTALGRVYSGAHFPLDVLAGALLGLLVALSLRALLGRFLGPAAAPTSG